jgi:hypothetical protein
MPIKSASPERATEKPLDEQHPGGDARHAQSRTEPRTMPNAPAPRWGLGARDGDRIPGASALFIPHISNDAHRQHFVTFKIIAT